jgi:hypothetical protein
MSRRQLLLACHWFVFAITFAVLFSYNVQAEMSSADTVDCDESIAQFGDGSAQAAVVLVAESQQAAQQSMKGKGKKDNGPVITQQFCVKRKIQAGDTAHDGSACTSGRVCSSPGANCDVADPSTVCRTIHLGSGNCTCSCVIP